ncbi:hypothetical protein Pcac1_g7107 [Phytophthora cactorum]|uniref:G domain-containing protein n=6 Tax=Phytophthora cactorum TaxID=29920 RepID=A0A329RXA9_9STRA|nr:hypothetical protein Pcac1_g7107 [Phytophthora cactorum]KAG2807452.1 hypothetical protein PC112_g17390 [Phytophthora cactorum]KAG2850789.1 hypothetical protein PC113_g16477 [Phytophthora cactorum]RAW29317.1 hypothetical protein PC110_g14320 [Phytophthora cactorum]
MDMSSLQESSTLRAPLSTSIVASPQNYLFLGNPGTGKSTLINCLAGAAIFKSGLSYGGGLTKEFQTRIHDNVQYMDTPGLADRNIQEKAAAAITEALRQSGTYKLFFMVRLENGRVVSDDLATIEIVLSSIELDEIPFAVIVNNVKKRQYTKMMEKSADYLKVVTLINSINHTTPHIVFIPVIGDLDEEDNAVTKLPVDVERFIREAPGVQIPPHVVKPIKIEDFKKVSETLRGEQEQLLNDKVLLERRLAELMKESNSFGSVLCKMGGFSSSTMAGYLPFRGGQSTRHPDVFNPRRGTNLNTGVAAPQAINQQTTTLSPMICYSKPDTALATSEIETRTTGAAYSSGAASITPEEKTQLTPTSQQIQTMEMTHIKSGEKIQQCHHRAHELKNEAVNRLVETGVISHDSISNAPALEKMPQVGDPVEHTVLKTPLQTPHLDEDGDEKMLPTPQAACSF